jgi:predicted ArsR family transcriptional regulator
MNRLWRRKEVRKNQITLYLLGREAKSIREVAKGLKISYYTASRLLADMFKDELVHIQNPHTYPKRYYIPMRK